MKITSLAIGLAVFVCPMYLAQAAPKDDVLKAAKKLAEAGGYTWKSTMEGGQWAVTPTVGKIGKDGVAVVSRTIRDNTFRTVHQGDKAAMETQDGWQSMAEMEAGGQERRGRFMARWLQNFKAPAAEVEDMLKNVPSLALAEGAYTGKLTEAGVKDMLAFGRRGGGQGPEIGNASGSVKIWLKDGLLAKYQHTVKGTMSFGGNDRDIDRTTTIEISDVGTTTVELPAAAKAKL